MAKIDFTPAQAQAILERGGALLVAASAGSGKTRVLVERLLERIAGDAAAHSINEYLIITYTKAAAAELKGRIMDELASRIAEEPDNRRLRRQLDLCCNADISTIHSFCSNIIRDNAHLLGISADYRIAEESESNIIRRTTLEKLLDARYEDMEGYPAFQTLVDMMSAGRDDSKLADIILETYAKLKSHTSLEKWAEEQLKMYDVTEIGDVSETLWGKMLLNKYKSEAEWWISELDGLLDKMNGYEDFNAAYGPSVTATRDALCRFAKAAGKSWDDAVSCAEIDFPKPKPIGGYDDFKDVRTKCRSAVKKITESLKLKSDDLLEDIAALAPAVRALVQAVVDFDKAYGGEKHRRGILDYSDLEHYALRLLIDEETGQCTDVARAIAGKYDEIMVDEYQDVNAVQELIFSAVSKDGRNVFMVGDVKQSIYRFRLADPGIFLKKYNTFADAEDAADGEGRKIILAQNFRSRPGILDAANYVFKNVMSAEFGEMDYTEREYLRPGREFPETAEKEVELDVIDAKDISSDEEERPERIELEAEFVAGKIRSLIGGKMRVAGDGSVTRDLKCGDIAILLRSSKSKAPVFAAALERSGIPVSLSRGEDFFESIEINSMLSLLSVIDNPLQDIPLISAMRSPLYAFSADDLVDIRLKKKDGYFYDALTIAAETNDKCRAFLGELEAFRELAADMSSEKLLWHIYQESSALAVFGAMNGGETRTRNLKLLISCAAKFESAGYKGLFSFVLYMRQMMENGENPAAESEESSENAVRIMSIHKSKGLEFPVVILADLAKRFNMDDTKKPILVHPELGIGAKMRDLERKIEYQTIARQAIAEKIALETMAEELRVLYVAMTRAQEKLIMVCSYSNWERELKRIGPVQTLPVAPQILMNSRSAAEWILRTALARTEAGELTGGEKLDGEWDINLITDVTVEGRHKSAARDAHDVTVDEDLLAVITRNISFKYGDTAAENIPSKLTATEVKGLIADGELGEDAEYVVPFTREIKARRASFDREKPLSAAEKGTMIHMLLQHMELSKCTDRSAVEAETHRIALGGFVDEADITPADIDMLTSFFASKTGKRLTAASIVEREFKFSILIPASRFYDCGDDNELLLQGMIDCFFEENGELVIIDFKTDNVTKDNIEARAASYSGQIAAYKMALEEITGKKVKEAVLFFLRCGQTVNISIAE